MAKGRRNSGVTPVRLGAKLYEVWTVYPNDGNVVAGTLSTHRTREAAEEAIRAGLLAPMTPKRIYERPNWTAEKKADRMARRLARLLAGCPGSTCRIWVSPLDDAHRLPVRAGMPAWPGRIRRRSTERIEVGHKVWGVICDVVREAPDAPLEVAHDRVKDLLDI